MLLANTQPTYSVLLVLPPGQEKKMTKGKTKERQRKKNYYRKLKWVTPSVRCVYVGLRTRCRKSHKNHKRRRNARRYGFDVCLRADNMIHDTPRNRIYNGQNACDFCRKFWFYWILGRFEIELIFFHSTCSYRCSFDWFLFCENYQLLLHTSQ